MLRISRFLSSVGLGLALVSGCAIYQTNHPPETPAERTSVKKSPKKPKKPRSESEVVATKKPKAKKPKGKEKPSSRPPASIAQPVAPPAVPPEPTPVAPPVRALDTAEISIPVSVALEDIMAEIDAVLPKTQKQAKKRVTGKGASPEVEVAYEMWRDPVQASFEDGALQITIPIRYAAKIDSRVKNPLGGDWIQLTRGETWGTKREPQRVKVKVSVALNVSEKWDLKATAKLVSIRHGEPPSGDACASGIPVCVKKSSLTDEVRSRMDADLRKKIEAMLDQASRKVEASFHLRKQVERLWAGLQQPVELQKAKQKDCLFAPGAPCERSHWIQFVPEKLALGDVRKAGEDLRVDLGLSGRLVSSEGKKPSGKSAPLPEKVSQAGPSGFRVRTTVHLSVEKALAKLKAGQPEAFAKAVDAAKLTLKNKKPQDSASEIELQVELGKLALLRVTGKFQLDEKSKEVRLEKAKASIDLHREAISAAGLDEGVIRSQLAGDRLEAIEQHFEQVLRFSTASVGSAFERKLSSGLFDAVSGAVEFKVDLKRFEMVDASSDADGPAVQVELLGDLRARLVKTD